MATPDLSGLELYPLATDKGVPIPLELARPLGSFMVPTNNTPVSGVVSVGQIVAFYATHTVRLLITNDAAVIALDKTYLAESMYIPAGANVIVQVQGTIIRALADNTAAKLYASVLTVWKSTANARDMENA
jgi:hypothetical protein